MGETCCFAYNELGTIQMEQFLYHMEYYMYNSSGFFENPLDDLIYYQLFECAGD